MYEDFTLADTSADAFTEAGERTCLSTHKMAMLEVDDFYTLVKKSTKYTDRYFMNNENSLFWRDLDEDKTKNAKDLTEKHITW